MCWTVFPTEALMAVRSDGIWAQLELLIASPKGGLLSMGVYQVIYLVIQKTCLTDRFWSAHCVGK